MARYRQFLARLSGLFRRGRLTLRVCPIALMGLVVTAVFAQTPLTFEVASVKVHPFPYQVVKSEVSGPRATWEAYGLEGLIMEAYRVDSYQISRGPAWLASDRFDINAKAPGDRTLTADRKREMLRALLEDRFQLKVHRETREQPVYSLVVAKGGPKLKASSEDARPGMTLESKGQAVEILFSKWDMARLAGQISGNEGRKVVDKTGLSGEYDITLSYADDRRAAGGQQDGPSLFTALQEQLGLKLESQKGPVEVLVIDHAEKPSEN